MPKKAPLYGVHPGVQILQKSIASMKENGTDVGGMAALAKQSGSQTEKKRRQFLKNQYGLGSCIAAR